MKTMKTRMIGMMIGSIGVKSCRIPDNTEKIYEVQEG